MSINYALAKIEGPKLKAELTRAEKSDPTTRYKKVLAACRHAVERWEVWGAWPDNWSRWQRTLDDAAFQHSRTNRENVIPPRLEDIPGQAAVVNQLVSGGSGIRVRLELPAEAARKLMSATPEELSKALGIPVKSVTLVEPEDETERRLR
jgi:hypothetical protein